MKSQTDPFVRPRYLAQRKASTPADFPVRMEPLSIQAGLEPYASPLTIEQARHLLRRTGMGANPTEASNLVGTTGVDAVAEMVARATNTNELPFPEPPVWADTPPPASGSSQAEIDAFVANNAMWLTEYLGEMMEWFYKGGLRERTLLMWHNHFVTEIDVYILATLAYRYVDMLRRHSMGNFKDFVHEVGLSPAMLWYLNGNTNEKAAPNENYGRELLELFTMGPKDRLDNDNYTQSDIEEIARALTGWVNDYPNNATVFVESRHDEGEKTFFGRTGTYGYDDVIDIIFEERPAEIAYFICAKIYRTFVYDIPSDEIVQGLAGIFLSNNFEIAPVIQALLQSAHFFDEQVIGAKIKSPVEMITGTMLENDFTPSLETLQLLPRGTDIIDQTLLSPPNVAGWPGHRFWVSTTTLPLRWLVSDFMLYSGDDLEPLDLVSLSRLFPEGEAADSAFALPIALARHYIAVDIAQLDIGEVDQDFGGDLITFPIPEEVLNGPEHAVNLAKIFLSGVPWYEWNLDVDGANILLLNYVRYLSQLPEFHLI